MFNRYYSCINPCEAIGCSNEFLSARSIVWEHESPELRDLRRKRVICHDTAKMRWEQVRRLQAQLVTVAAEANSLDSQYVQLTTDICMGETKEAVKNEELKEAYSAIGR